MHALIFLPWDESERYLYERIIAPRFPDLTVETVGTLDGLKANVTRADILMSFGVRLPRGIFANTPQLKWVHAFGTGVDGIADQETLRRDVLITSTPAALRARRWRRRHSPPCWRSAATCRAPCGRRTGARGTNGGCSCWIAGPSAFSASERSERRWRRAARLWG